tara:strand:- start:6 stop:191 length:186 start_codon:yes stop_codon:yes gene_type:complete
VVVEEVVLEQIHGHMLLFKMELQILVVAVVEVPMLLVHHMLNMVVMVVQVLSLLRIQPKHK